MQESADMNSSDPTALRDVMAGLQPSNYLRGLWDRRIFIVALSTEKIRTRHQDTFLGGVWHLLNPMLTVGVYFIVFGLVLNSSRGVEHFLAWLAIGVFSYRLTSNAASSGSSSISSNQGLIRSLRFPRATLPLSVVLGDLYTFRYDLIAVLLITLIMGVMPSARLLVLPIIIVVHATLNVGLALIAARLGDTIRDVQQFIPFVFRLMQFMSGVIYPLSRFAESEHHLAYKILMLNPVAHIIEMYRWAFLGTYVRPSDVGVSVAACLVLLLVGFRYFIGAEAKYGRA